MPSNAQTIAAAAAAAGFSESYPHWVTAVSVALAESSGVPSRVGDHDRPRRGCASYGAWQINSCPDMPAGAPRYGGNPAPLLDLLTNARAAFAISSRGTNWSAWSTYPAKANGHRAAATAAVDWAWSTKAGNELVAKFGGAPGVGGGNALGGTIDDPGAVLGDVIGAVTDPLATVSAFLRLVTDWQTWRRVLLIVVGLLLILAAVLLLTADLSAPVVRDVLAPPAPPPPPPKSPPSSTPPK